MLEAAGQGATRQGRQAAEAVVEGWGEAMAVVAAEEFIAGVAAEGHGEATAPGFAADQMGGQLGGIGEGLAVKTRQLGNQGAGIGGGEGHLGVVGAEVIGDGAGERGFVEAALGAAGIRKGDGEAAHRPAALGLEQGGDKGGVDATGEKGTEGHIGDGLLGHGLLQGLFQGRESLGLSGEASGGSGGSGGCLSLQIPPGEGRRELRGRATLRAGVDRDPMTGRQLLQTRLNAEGSWNTAKPEEGRQGGGIHRG